MKIDMVSEHASPLAAIGGVDAGGQNVHVAALAAGLARRGHEVTVFTRRDDDALPEQVVTQDGYDVAFCYRANGEIAEEVALEAGKFGGRVTASLVDRYVLTALRRVPQQQRADYGPSTQGSE